MITPLTSYFSGMNRVAAIPAPIPAKVQRRISHLNRLKAEMIRTSGLSSPVPAAGDVSTPKGSGEDGRLPDRGVISVLMALMALLLIPGGQNR